MSEKKYLNSLSRGLEALSLLNKRDRLTGSELARQLDVPRTTAHRILETLANEGYVLHDVANRCFRLSKKIRHIAFGFNRRSLVAEIARPILQGLSRETLMPVGLTMPMGTQIVMQVSTDHEAPLALELVKEGATFPLTYGASGHIYLAHCSKEVRERLLLAAAQVDTDGIIDPVPSDGELDRIRANGYAFSPVRDEQPEWLIAVPVYCKGEFVACAHLRFMRRVMSREKVMQQLLPKLLDAARQVELKLVAAVDD